MSLSCVEVDRFSVGGFGDLRLQKRGLGVMRHLLCILAHAFWNLAVAFATWVIARLGAWTGYYGKPGPATLARGLQKYHAVKYGARMTRGIV